VCITGNGLKTQEAVLGKVGETIPIDPTLASLDAALKSRNIDAQISHRTPRQPASLEPALI
jgi:hypothetical protein